MKTCIEMKTKGILQGPFFGHVNAPCKLYALWEFSGYLEGLRCEPSDLMEGHKVRSKLAEGAMS